MTLRVAVSGATGRMGGAVGRLAAAADDLELVGGIAPEPGDGDSPFGRVVPVADAADVIEAAGAIVDFSAPEHLAELIERHGDALAGRALVVGTTGLGEREQSLLGRVAGEAPVLVAANFSAGVNLLLHLVREAAAALPAEEFDIEIVEAHHRRKADAPSGTALALARAAAEARGVGLDEVRRDGRSGRVGERPTGEIGMHAVRGGGVVGEHDVGFLGEQERIELRHVAADRDVFAAGALRAARWLHGRPPGRYDMSDVLGLGGR